jgi:hypothetical protein
MQQTKMREPNVKRTLSFARCKLQSHKKLRHITRFRPQFQCTLQGPESFG